MGLPTALYTNGDIPYQKGFVFARLSKPADSGHPEEQHSVPVGKHRRLPVRRQSPRAATRCFSRERPLSRAPQEQTVRCVLGIYSYLPSSFTPEGMKRPPPPSSHQQVPQPSNGLLPPTWTSAGLPTPSTA